MTEKERKRTGHKSTPPEKEQPETASETPISQATEETSQVSMQEFQQLNKELEETRQKSNENFEGWQRERADFSNYRKRIDREQGLLTQTITGDIIKRYLIIIDDLERALKLRPQDGDGALWAEGIELIYRKLTNILEQEGITRIPAEKEEFDPTRHEALSYEESPDHSSNQIIEVIEQGYMHGDRVLRPARVRVAR